MTVTEQEHSPAIPADEKPVLGKGARGYLEAQVKRVLDAYVMGDLVVPAGKALTPHRIARQIDENLKADGIKFRPMSTGSVDACLHRWTDIGYIRTGQDPFAFEEYTEDALAPKGLAWCKNRRAEQLKAARKAKGTDKAASTEEPEPVYTRVEVEEATYIDFPDDTGAGAAARADDDGLPGVTDSQA